MKNIKKIIKEIAKLRFERANILGYDTHFVLEERMATKIYYTVEKETRNINILEKETQTIDTVEACTGWKNIQVYEIANDRPKQWFEIEVRNDESSEKGIQTWLDNNGFEDREYNMIWL